jgi:hypothetical protein
MPGMTCRKNESGVGTAISKAVVAPPLSLADPLESRRLLGGF